MTARPNDPERSRMERNQERQDQKFAEDMSDIVRHDPELDPALAEVLSAAYAQDLDVETAARHLWSIHRAGNPVVPATRQRMRKAAVTMLSAAMLVMSSGGALAASNSALPGDMLYPVKRGAERARLILAVSPEADAKVHLLIARRRMAEAQQAMDRARPAVVPQLVNAAVEALEVAERVGGPELADATQEVRREASAQAVELAAALENPDREQVTMSASRLSSPEVEEAPQPEPAPRPTDSTEAKAEKDTGTVTASPPPADGTPTPTTPTPEPTGTESPSPSPTATSSPSPAPAPTATAETPATTEAAPVESGGHSRYESEGDATPSPSPSDESTEGSPGPAATGSVPSDAAPYRDELSD